MVGSPHLLDFLLNGQAGQGQKKTTSGILPPTIDSAPFLNYREDPSQRAYGQLNSVAQQIASARAFADTQYAAKKEKARLAAIAKQQAALIHNNPVFSGGGLNNTSPLPNLPGGGGVKLPKVYGGAQSPQVAMPKVGPGYTEGQFGAIMGAGQPIITDTHIKQPKSKPWYQFW